ncbi:MAG: MATE family efflux transporter [Clostridium sp.]
MGRFKRSKEVLRVACPAALEMFLYMMVWVADTAFVGRYDGTIGVSAVGLASEVLYTIANIFITFGVGIGITTLVAQSIGEGNKKKASEFLSHGVLIGAIVGAVLCIILGGFASNILSLVGAKDQVLEVGSKYMQIASIGLIFNMLSSMLNAGLRGSGNTITPLKVSGIIVVINIFLDYSMIFGKFGFPEFGVIGSAIATSISYLIGFIVLCYFYRSSELKIIPSVVRKIDISKIKSLVKLSIPAGLQEAAFSVSKLITLSFIMHLGSVAYAANQIVVTIESISYMPGWGFAVAATAMVGQRIGAKDFKTAKEYAYQSTIFGTGIMMICALIFILIPSELMSIFISDPQTIEFGTRCLMFAALEQPFIGVAMVLAGALKGSGDTKTPFYVAIVSNWFIRLPLMYIVIFVLKLDVVTVWIVTAIQWIFEGIVITYLFKRKTKKWIANEK